MFKPIAAELGISRAATSVAASIGRFEGGFEAPLSGWITDRFGPRWIVILGVFLIGLGLILMNFIDSLWAYYVVWGAIAGTGANIALTLPLDKAVANWFVKKRGLALSIKWVLSGLGTPVMLPTCCLAYLHTGLADDLPYRWAGYMACWLAHCLVLRETAPTRVLWATS